MLHNKAMSEAFGLNMRGSAINFAVLLRMFQASNLRWEMNYAQVFSIEIQSVFIDPPVVLETETPSEQVKELFKKDIKHTLLGVPVKLRDDYPEGWIRLYAGDKLVAYATNLAIPATFSSHVDWEAHEQRERDKAAKMWEADNA